MSGYDSHRTRPRRTRPGNFVTGTLLDWGLDNLVPSAALVVSELVTNAVVHAGTDIALSVAFNLRRVRLTVRDNSPSLPRWRYADLDLHGRGLSVVAGLSRAFGVLPTAERGADEHTGDDKCWAKTQTRSLRSPERKFLFAVSFLVGLLRRIDGANPDRDTD